jgi:hypothetical protein
MWILIQSKQATQPNCKSAKQQTANSSVDKGGACCQQIRREGGVCEKVCKNNNNNKNSKFNRCYGCSCLHANVFFGLARQL